MSIQLMKQTHNMKTKSILLLTMLTLFGLVTLFSAALPVHADLRSCPPPYKTENYGSPLNLSECDLSGADLTFAILSYANLNDADLSGADLTGSDLQGAKLVRTDLIGANLTGTNLWGASLLMADLSGANLRGAFLFDANLRGANLTGANLTSANLASVEFNSNTIWNDVIWSNTICPDRTRSSDYTPEMCDVTPPIIFANISGTQGNEGWYVTDVTVSWTVSDPETAVSSRSGCGTRTFTSDMLSEILVCSATSSGGTSRETVQIKRDATAPTASSFVSPVANGNGWHNNNVTVSFSGTDNLSGIVSCEPDVILSREGSGLSASGTCTDRAGNMSTPASVNINIDKTAPVVSVTGVTDGAIYILGSVPTAGCTTSDALSGVATMAALTLSGGNPEGSGVFTATCAGAVDNADNSGFASVTYTVLVPQEAIGNLQDKIDDLVISGILKNGQANGLKQPLGNAIHSLDRGDVTAACNQLTDFIAEVNLKTPSPLDNAAAADLIADAEAIQSAIGCP